MLKETYFSKTPIKIDKVYIDMKDIHLFTNNKSIDDYLSELKKDNCLQCMTCHNLNLLPNQSLKRCRLPCNCVVYSEKCLVDLFIILFNNYHNKKTDDIYCFCSHKYSIAELRSVMDVLNKISEKIYQSNLIFFNKTFIEYLVNVETKRCSLCLKDTHFSEITYSDFTNTLVETKKHLCCEECEKKINKCTKYQCTICKKEHSLVKTKILNNK